MRLYAEYYIASHAVAVYYRSNILFCINALRLHISLKGDKTADRNKLVVVEGQTPIKNLSMIQEINQSNIILCLPNFDFFEHNFIQTILYSEKIKKPLK